MSMRLRELIRAVRACKTAAEERGVVAQECARIRTAFKEEDTEFRNRNVAKLLFIHMLGYPSHFGQMECIKLITSPNYMDKRIGYLGLTLLLTDQEEVLMLVTNSLKVDMHSSNMFVAGLSLTTIGNLATPDIARDLMMEVEKHLRGGRPYLVKKAALCCIRILRHLPEHVEDFMERIMEVLKDRHHGVLVAGVQLVTAVVESDPKEYAPAFASVAPSLVKMLRNLLSVGYAPEHDVAGVSDPFLQVHILRLLRLLGQHAEGVTDTMSDALAQVASNTETAKNAGNAILYECVQTIMTLDTENGLKVLAVNILGRFLLNRDNNIRYVALKTLGKVVQLDPASVQRHRSTIVDCLKDPDISIRQRALELIHQLVNESTVVSLTREMLNYLVVAMPEHKAQLCDKITAAAERYAPDRRWRIETLITMLSIAGSHCNERITSGTIMYIGQCKEFHGQAVHKLAAALQEDMVAAPSGLMKVAVWCIGEFADLLASPQDAFPAVEGGSAMCPAQDAMPHEEIIDLLEDLLNHHSATASSRSSALTALAKASYRLGEGLGEDGKARVEEMLEGYRSSITLELQQRSCEYLNLLSPQWDVVKKEALDRMPVMDEEAFRERRARYTMGAGMGAFDDAPGAGDRSPKPQGSASSSAPAAGPSPSKNGLPIPSSSSNGGGDLLDLEDIFGGGGASAPAAVAAVVPPAVAVAAPGAGNGAAAAGGVDLLADVFGGGGGLVPSKAAPANATAAQAPVAAAPATAAAVGGDSDDFGGFEVAPPRVEKMVAFDKSGLRIVFSPSKPDASDPSKSKVSIAFSNTSDEEISGLVFQAAVPKSFTMKMGALSGHNLPPHSDGVVSQEISVTNAMQGTKSLMMKLKIQFRRGTVNVAEVAQVAQFPAGF
ncbi:unnamed protein product [Ectocarpus sp. CCAP 1310/34]|nr:unnamed protein product [Ectocarpus sp. CCAP 1310/34]